MVKFFERFILLMMFTLAVPAHADDVIRVVVYGDSLMSGYQMQPEQSFGSKVERKIKEVGFTNVQVINMSVAGETTAGGLERINSAIAQRPDIFVLSLGANDALRGIRPEIVNYNLGTMIGLLKQKNIYVILVGIKAPPNLGTDYSTQLEGMFRHLAKTYEVPLYPFALVGVFGRRT